MKPQRRVFVVGGAQTTFLGHARPEYVPLRDVRRGRGANPTAQAHLTQAVQGALDATGVDPTAIERAWVGNFLGECFVRQGHMGALLAAACPALQGRPIARMEAACASGGVSLATAIDALQAVCDVALVVGVEVETTVRGRAGADHMALAAHWEQQRGLSEFVFPHLFALRAKAWKATTGGTARDLARITHKSRQNAALNDQALHRFTQTTLDALDEISDTNRVFLEDPAVRPHMRISDSTEFADGAAAVLLATEAGLRRIGRSPADCTEIRSVGFQVQGLGAPVNPARLTNIAAAAAEAYAHADITPDQLDMAEVHDCFSVTEAQLYGALGLCAHRDAPAFIRDGAAERSGSVPVNPGGGLLGAGHPVGATGVRQVLEVWRQMTGRAGGHQLERRPQRAVTANLGGDDRTAVVMVHQAP